MQVASSEAAGLVSLCSKSSTEQNIAKYILQTRKVCFRNRLLMRQAVATEPKARCVFDASYAGNIFVSLASKPFGKFVMKGNHPEVYSQDILTHANSWHLQFLSCDTGASSVLMLDVRKMDKSILHGVQSIELNSP